MFYIGLKILNSQFIVGVTEVGCSFKFREPFQNFDYLVVAIITRAFLFPWRNRETLFASEQISGFFQLSHDQVQENTAKGPDVGSLSILPVDCYDLWGTVKP